MEFHHMVCKLRKEITEKLISDFGIKHKVRQIHIYGDKIVRDGIAPATSEETEETDTIFTEVRKNKTTELTVIEDYPRWLINQFRISIMNIFRDLMHDVTMANSIYPINDTELQERRFFQNKAIGECEFLIQELQYAADILPVKFSSLMRYAADIDKLIAVLKGWRQANKKIKDGLEKRDKNFNKGKA
jgi:hypothetical protein